MNGNWRSSLHAAQFGAAFDGVTDDAVALQAAINAAHREGKELVLPSGTALLGSGLDLKGKNITIRGAGMSQTIIRASAAMTTMLDVEETSDIIVSPLHIEGVRLSCKVSPNMG